MLKNSDATDFRLAAILASSLFSLLFVNRMGKRKKEKKKSTEGKPNQDRLMASGSSTAVAPAAPQEVPVIGQSLLTVALLMLVLLAFTPLFRNGFINYDDPGYVLENFHVQSTITWQSIRWAFLTSLNSNWHPLTWLSHMLDFQMFGLRPWGHHLTSLLIHAANTCLVFVVL